MAPLPTAQAPLLTTEATRSTLRHPGPSHPWIAKNSLCQIPSTSPVKDCIIRRKNRGLVCWLNGPTDEDEKARRSTASLYEKLPAESRKCHQYPADHWLMGFTSGPGGCQRHDGEGHRLRACARYSVVDSRLRGNDEYGTGSASAQPVSGPGQKYSALPPPRYGPDSGCRATHDWFLLAGVQYVEGQDIHARDHTAEDVVFGDG